MGWLSLVWLLEFVWDLLGSWRCSVFHRHSTIRWVQTETQIAVYVQCTQQGCRRESTGMIYDRISEEHYRRSATRRPFWWREYNRKVYASQGFRMYRVVSGKRAH